MKNNTESTSPLRRLLTGGAMLCACLLVIFLSLISLDLALIAATACTLTYLFFMGRKETKNLEHFLQNSLEDLSSRQNALEKAILSHEEELRKMEQHLSAQPKSPSNKPAPQKAFSLQEIIPAFLKPQGWSKTAQIQPDTSGDDDVFEHPPLSAYSHLDFQTEAEHRESFSETFAANDEIMLDDQSLSDMVVRELVHHAVRNNRVDVFIQPILRLPQRQTKYYEMFARIRAKAGVYLPAKRFMTLAAEENVMNTIDNMLLLNGLQALKKNHELNRVSSFFINIKPTTIRDQIFMRDLLSFLSQNRELAPSLIFEMRQSDFEFLSSGEQKILDGLAQLGCGLSLDHLRTIPEDIKLLQGRKIRFVKIEAEKMLQATKSDREFADIMRRKRKLEANGIGVIIEKIENESDLLELLDFNINYGQGFLFGKPDLQGVYAHRRAS